MKQIKITPNSILLEGVFSSSELVDLLSLFEHWGFDSWGMQKQEVNAGMPCLCLTKSGAAE